MNLITPDAGTIFWMLIAFSTVLFTLRRFAWKPILNALKEREHSITSALKAADKAKEEMAKLHADNEKIIQEGKAERDKLIKEAREVKEQILSEAKQKANEEGQKLIEAAKQSIRNEKAAAMNDIKNQIAQISLEIAEKVLQEKLKDNKAQTELIEKNLDNIKLN
jgi:F-type H+-transporting ATPase subunit b